MMSGSSSSKKIFRNKRTTPRYVSKFRTEECIRFEGRRIELGVLKISGSEARNIIFGNYYRAFDLAMFRFKPR